MVTADTSLTKPAKSLNLQEGRCCPGYPAGRNSAKNNKEKSAPFFSDGFFTTYQHTVMVVSFFRTCVYIPRISLVIFSQVNRDE